MRKTINVQHYSPDSTTEVTLKLNSTRYRTQKRFYSAENVYYSLYFVLAPYKIRREGMVLIEERSHLGIVSYH